MAVLTMTVDHQIYYSNEKRIPIKNVIKGLLAAETLIDELKPSIKKIFDDVDIKEINIYLDKLESGSLSENFIIDLVFGGEEEYKKFREKLCKIRNAVFSNSTDDEDKKTMRQVLGLLLAAGIASGATWAILSDNDPVPQSIKNYTTNINNSVIGVGDGALTGQQIVDIVSATVDKKKIAKAAVDFVKPAKDDSKASISLDDNDQLTLKPEFVKATPSSYTPPQPEEKIETYTNVDVYIAASDARKRRQGWAGVAKGIVDTATKITLTEDIDPNKLHGNVNIKADISIIKKYDPTQKDYVIKEILIKDWT
ncbi:MULTISPECIES: hypothetical protein [unclassified Methylophaga]|jgi:hypothetical protein|uniref:hypothetical protein n=1 Tax=unclassified Methylophaga TaxID=2629249 RepID=UPI00259CA162|nr:MULTISPECIES: hypothetical protein [unclassified Methylophaga]|tara:strand:- start:37156 stop:38085 length:930 start_codon:yes stop_codon:yes gene_type:complete